jgi:hypothetical protein
MTLPEGKFVTVSGRAVPAVRAASLEEAMQTRLRLVETSQASADCRYGARFAAATRTAW